MEAVSNYVSLAIILMITLALTYNYITMISDATMSIEHVLNNENNICISVRETINTKYVLINKTCISKIIEIIGSYKVLLNTSTLLLLETNIMEKITIVSEDDIIEI